MSAQILKFSRQRGTLEPAAPKLSHMVSVIFSTPTMWERLTDDEATLLFNALREVCTNGDDTDPVFAEHWRNAIKIWKRLGG